MQTASISAIVDVFRNGFTQNGGRIVAAESYKEGDIDFRTQATNRFGDLSVSDRLSGQNNCLICGQNNLANNKVIIGKVVQMHWTPSSLNCI